MLKMKKWNIFILNISCTWADLYCKSRLTKLSWQTLLSHITSEVLLKSTFCFWTQWLRRFICTLYVNNKSTIHHHKAYNTHKFWVHYSLEAACTLKWQADGYWIYNERKTELELKMFYHTQTAHKLPKSPRQQRWNGPVCWCVTLSAASMFHSVASGARGGGG